VAAEDAPTGIRMCDLPPAGSGERGTVYNRTRTDLTKWFLAAYLMGRDKRGVSAKFLQRELGVAYQTAWTMVPSCAMGRARVRRVRCAAFWKRTRPSSVAAATRQVPVRSTVNPGKSLVVAAVEKVLAPKKPERKARARRQAPARAFRR
jgi:hypothetical protein